MCELVEEDCELGERILLSQARRVHSVVNRPPSKEFSKLHTSFANMFIPDAVHVESKCDESGDVQMKKDQVKVARSTV